MKGRNVKFETTHSYSEDKRLAYFRVDKLALALNFVHAPALHRSKLERDRAGLNR